MSNINPSSAYYFTITKFSVKQCNNTLSKCKFSHLPAPFLNGGDRPQRRCKNFELSRSHYLDLGMGHTTYPRTLIIDLHLHAIFHLNRKTFCGQTDG